MNALDILCLVIISASIVICTLKGLKKIIFKVCAFFLAMLLAKLFGFKVGDLVIPELVKDNKLFGSEMAEKIDDSIASVVGTIIIFIVSFVILRLIFKIVEFKLGSSMQSIVINRLLGALVGLFAGVAVVLAFTEVVNIIASVSVFVDQGDVFFDAIDNSVIFKFFRNLN